MSLSERLTELVHACFTGLWIESHEHEDALAEIALLCHHENWRLVAWDIAGGLQIYGEQQLLETGTNDPLAAIRSLASFPASDQPTLLVLVNFHRFLQSAEVVQTVSRQLAAGKQNRTFIVVLSPLVQIPVELEKNFQVLSHELPGREQLAAIARGIATQEDERPDGAEWERLLDAAAGLTRNEAESAFSLSLVRHGRVQVETLWEHKAQMLKKSGQADSGVSARLFGTFLSWLNDHESDVFVVATANDISKLPPEFSRAERFDGVFFLDFPDGRQRPAIWQIYLTHYQLDATQKIPADEHWTGAEIKACCRLAALLDVPLVAAAQNIVPVARTSAESVDRLRNWASGRCLSADHPGLFQLAEPSPASTSGTRRRVSRGNPASN